ncbi:hypothetical protein DFS33DRAFT_546600 [Desarmillaria ectypa]|nr:hypothetical protein DFS33DRAFT_546600 [Desarmillaria ectypa]
MSKSKRRNQRQAGQSAASTSSRNALSGEDALEFLFDYRPKFTKRAGFTGSAGTRDLAQYDMHMHSQLILKDIILFPDMLKQLAGVADPKRFPQTRGTRKLPRVPAGHDLHPQRIPENLKAASGFTIGPEIDLRRQYPNLQNLSSRVASTLFAGLDQWSSIFQYDEKPTSMMPYALADGYLSLDRDAIAKARLPKDLDSDIQLVIETGFSDFLFWEFKSMNAGSEGVMRAIRHLAGSEFPWVRCPKSWSCGGRFCQKTNNRSQFTVTGHKTGEDGGILEDASEAEFSVSNGNALRFDKSTINFSVTSVLKTSGRKSKGGERKTRKETKKRSRSGDESDEVEGDDIEGDGGAHHDSVHKPLFNDGDFTKALKIIQQVWAEAVNIDATFMVLNAGSREFIGIRDRKLQRLYLSPLIDLDDPVGPPAGYFKIHAGLQIAALLDAIERAKRLKALLCLPKLYTFKYDRAESCQDKAPNPVKMPRPSDSAMTPKAAKAEILAHADEDNEDYCSGSEITLTPEEQELFQQLREAGSLKISWNKHIYRLGPASSMTVTRSDASPPNDTEMEVHIMGQYPKSIHSYYCYADNGRIVAPGIVIKFTRSAHDIVGLRNEYDMYTQLSKIRTIAEGLGIPEHVGLYEREDDTVLVLMDSGDSAPMKFKNRTPNDVYSQVEAAVRKMHFAKITHGELIPENVLVTRNEQEKQGQWNIHFISWKNGQDHRRLFTAQKAHNSYTLQRSPRRTWKQKGRCKPLYKKGGHSQEQRGTDGYQAASARAWVPRRKAFPSRSYGSKSLFLISEKMMQQWNIAVEKDRKRLDDIIWNRY